MCPYLGECFISKHKYHSYLIKHSTTIPIELDIPSINASRPIRQMQVLWQGRMLMSDWPCNVEFSIVLLLNTHTALEHLAKCLMCWTIIFLAVFMQKLQFQLMIVILSGATLEAVALAIKFQWCIWLTSDDLNCVTKRIKLWISFHVRAMLCVHMFCFRLDLWLTL